MNPHDAFIFLNTLQSLSYALYALYLNYVFYIHLIMLYIFGYTSNFKIRARNKKSARRRRLGSISRQKIKKKTKELKKNESLKKGYKSLVQTSLEQV